MIRRYTELRPSKGTVIPPDIREAVLERDKGYCVCDRAGFPPEVVAACPKVPVELDHVRASHGMGMKSETSVDNLASLSGPCHRYKTAHGREVRPLLIDYIDRVTAGECGHVDPHLGCGVCAMRWTA